jgi:hypothetical protein
VAPKAESTDLAELAGALAQIVSEYDEKWSALDFAGVADLSL